MTFNFHKLELQTLLLFFPGLINRGDLHSNITMLGIFHIGCRPVINIIKFSSVYVSLFNIHVSSRAEWKCTQVCLNKTAIGVGLRLRLWWLE